MVRRNPRRERKADRYSAEVSHSLHNDNIRDAPAPPPIKQQDMNNLSPMPRERHFEKPRKLGATPFCGTLDPTGTKSNRRFGKYKGYAISSSTSSGRNGKDGFLGSKKGWTTPRCLICKRYHFGEC